MPRPPRFDADELLDAAVLLAAAGGPAAVTMSAVAQTVGAPSGSVYHRFPGRPALLAEVWLRTVEDFQEGYLAALDGDPDPAGRPAPGPDTSWPGAGPTRGRRRCSCTAPKSSAGLAGPRNTGSVRIEATSGCSPDSAGSARPSA